MSMPPPTTSCACHCGVQAIYLYHCGFYLFQIAHSLRMDAHSTSRPDFASMLLHHAVSLALLVASYCAGLTRIGAVVLLLHDPADILLNAAKFLKLIRMHRLCNAVFSLLCAVSFSSRIIIFPVRYESVWPWPLCLPLRPQ